LSQFAYLEELRVSTSVCAGPCTERRPTPDVGHTGDRTVALDQAGGDAGCAHVVAGSVLQSLTAAINNSQSGNAVYIAAKLVDDMELRAKAIQPDDGPALGKCLLKAHAVSADTWFFWNAAAGQSLCMSKCTMGHPLPAPDYYRRQANICVALSLLAEDLLVAVALIEKAEEFLVKARQTECGDEFPPHVIDCDRSDENDTEFD
jgi:hypothetical protein